MSRSLPPLYSFNSFIGHQSPAHSQMALPPIPNPDSRPPDAGKVGGVGGDAGGDAGVLTT